MINILLKNLEQHEDALVECRLLQLHKLYDV